VAVAVAVVIVNSAATSGTHRTTVGGAHAAIRRLPPYWVVRSGDTYSEISAKTGLSIAELEAFNPNADPLAIAPGERLNLWAHPPRPRPKPPAPKFWTVRPGDSFGLIAARTGISLSELELLNPQLMKRTLQPGDRVQLRR
jgi:LysM repeat protein